MRISKNSIFYIGVIGGFSALMYLLVQKGSLLEVGRNVVIPTSELGHWGDFIASLMHNLGHPLGILLAQIVTIILVARMFGWICQRIGQPTVIGEIIAGIALGPSLLGMWFPEFSAALFPLASLGNLQFLSQIGLILFMFVVGMELDLKVLRNKAHDAVVISHASIIIPFALGMGLAYFVYARFAPEGVRFASFGLFLGIAMSITAFPVLARIVQERGLHRTKLGTVVITCAAADDITAWCLLAAVIAIVKAGDFVSSLYTIALAAGYVLLMLKVVRPFLKRVGELHSSRQQIGRPVVAIFFITLLLSAYATEIIGIHALFGAFMAGAIMPESARFRAIFTEKVEDVALVLLLPLFFVFTGLRTQIGLLNDPELWKVTGLIILVAVTGKFIGSAVAAKFVGQNWKDSLTIGALMNTRGLMELVVLNIGYDLGVLTPEIFAMMVIMALVTTFMTGPALDLINRFMPQSGASELKEAYQNGRYRVLVSFGNPDRGRGLLRMAHAFTGSSDGKASITAMHLASSDEAQPFNIEEMEQESFAPMIEESEQLGQRITTLFKLSGDIDSEIANVANKGDYDLLIIGIGRSIFEGTLLGMLLGFTTRIISPDRLLSKVVGRESLFDNSTFDERTRQIISRCNVPVGVLIDKGLDKVDRVLVPILSPDDAFLLEYIKPLIRNASAKVNVIDAAGVVKAVPHIKETVRDLEQTAPSHIALLSEKIITKEFLAQNSLMLVSLGSWKKLIESKSIWLNDMPSTLVLSDSKPISS